MKKNGESIVMKKKFALVFIIAVLALAACAPAAAVEEAVMEEPAVEEAMEEEVMEEDAMADEAMEDKAMEGEAMEDEAMAEDHDAMAAEVSFSTDVWPILEEFAVDAHGGKGGIFLESYEDILETVVPGDPENSMLYKALIADGMPQMPPSGPLPDEMIQTIYDWIAQGAKDN